MNTMSNETSAVLRISKIAVAGALALLFSLAVYGNLTDYRTNFAFVQHVLMMDTIFPDAAIRSRAINSPVIHHLAYAIIIFTEATVAALCWWGAGRMFARRKGSDRDFARAKTPALAGLTLGYLLWQVGMFAVGNEWFGMWMSKEWNGVDSLFRWLMMTLGALIFLGLRE